MHRSLSSFIYFISTLSTINGGAGCTYGRKPANQDRQMDTVVGFISDKPHHPLTSRHARKCLRSLYHRRPFSPLGLPGSSIFRPGVSRTNIQLIALQIRTPPSIASVDFPGETSESRQSGESLMVPFNGVSRIIMTPADLNRRLLCSSWPRRASC